jgi:hypothetical protein
MDENQVNDLLENVAYKIKKQDTVMREAISPQITLKIINNKLIFK